MFLPPARRPAIPVQTDRLPCGAQGRLLLVSERRDAFRATLPARPQILTTSVVTPLAELGDVSRRTAHICTIQRACRKHVAHKPTAFDHHANRIARLFREPGDGVSSFVKRHGAWPGGESLSAGGFAPPAGGTSPGDSGGFSPAGASV